MNATDWRLTKPPARDANSEKDAPVVVLAALIRRLALGRRRQVDRASPPARPPGTGRGAVAAADEGAPGEAEVALLDAVPAVLEAVLAGLQRGKSIDSGLFSGRFSGSCLPD